MKKALTALVSVVCCALVLTACADPKAFSVDERLSDNTERSDDITVTFHFDNGNTEPPSSYNTFANSITGFELKQFRSACLSNGGSFVFSPASSTLQTTMLASAASQELRQEILLAVGGELGVDDLNRGASYFKSRMESVSSLGLKKNEKPDNYVKLDGAMLIDDSIDVKTAYLQTVKNYVNYDIFRFDFDGENALDKVNGYLSAYSKQPEISLKNGTVNLVSAGNICDAWLNRYAKADIAKSTFHGANGNQTLDFMTSNESMIQSDTATGIVKYTADNPLKLVMIMPKDAKKLDEYIKNFDAEELSTLLNSVDVTKTATAVIPSFSVTSPKTAVASSGILSKSGLYSLFGKEAGFSSMSYTEKATVGEMYEIRPDFTLNAGGINRSDTSLADKSTVSKTDATVTFDHPFIFMLADNESNIPVWMGVYQ